MILLVVDDNKGIHRLPGLAISRGNLELYGNRVGVESVQGEVKGSSFSRPHYKQIH